MLLENRAAGRTHSVTRGVHIFEKPCCREIRAMGGRVMRGLPVSASQKNACTYVVGMQLYSGTKNVEIVELCHFEKSRILFKNEFVYSGGLYEANFKIKKLS